MAKSPAKLNQKQKVIEDLQQRILSGDIEAGDPLRQIHLSKEYGVAQTVIRESLQTLEQYGLVTIKENVGVFVREMGKKELIEAYQVREMLEGLAARLCCRTISRIDIEWLEEKAQEIYDSVDLPKAERSELEYQFHQRFLELSRNEALIRQSFGYRFVGNLVATNRDKDELLKEHLAIVKAIAENKPEEAEKAARLHVANSAEAIKKQAE